MKENEKILLFSCYINITKKCPTHPPWVVPQTRLSWCLVLVSTVPACAVHQVQLCCHSPPPTMTELTKLKSHPKVIIDFCFDNLCRHYLNYTKIFISSKITHRNICLLLLVIPIQLIGVESYCYHHKYLLVSL